jgi:hypothetical protein
MNDDDDFTGAYTEEILEPNVEGSGVTIADFRAYAPANTYIFTPCREPWPAASVNARLAPVPLLDENGQPKLNNKGKPVFIAATTWLSQNRSVEQLTWVPGMPMDIPGRLVVDGGWIEREDVAVFNLYRAPRIELGDATKAGPWIDHIKEIYPDNYSHIIPWLAHRVQRPEEKINHALVLGGAQGIGKDTMLEPVKYAIGPWNFKDISPTHLLGNFNSFVRAVILRVSEARDLGDVDRFTFYDHTKIYTATPPDVLRCNEKHLREHYVFNVLGFIITTNHKTDGIYLPADDRRHYVAWSDRTKEEFTPEYWNELWGWYARGGIGHVAAYLDELDLSEFDPKAPPPKTPAFWAIADASRAPENAELADVFDDLGNPDAVTLEQLVSAAKGAIMDWLLDRRNRRAIPHRLEECGYTPVRNKEDKRDGLWRIKGRRQAVYAKSALPAQVRLSAASDLVDKLKT